MGSPSSRTVIEVARQAGHSPEICVRYDARVFAEYDPVHRVPVVEQNRQARARLARERMDGVQDRLPGFD